MYYNFQLEYNVDSLGTPYDLKSMMHYSSTSFATRRGLKTITTIDRSKQNLIDTNDWISGFSETDIKQINLMYKCGKQFSKALILYLCFIYLRGFESSNYQDATCYDATVPWMPSDTKDFILYLILF